ncbi:hypothetical protein TrVGV298_000139 [Trichoderma virens]|nr:hypothetical protein TrVGV298_000139 [Trichoderma virens]
MAGKGIGCLGEAMAALRISASKPATTAFSRQFTRSMATESPVKEITKSAASAQSIIQSWNPISTVPVTIHSFPSLEPQSLEQWSVQHLYLPLRRDLLHLAVVYEGDNTRQGTASSKTRYDVHGSHRKMRPQKGTGRARQGTRQSPPAARRWQVLWPAPSRLWNPAEPQGLRQGVAHGAELPDGMELSMPHDFDLVADKYLKDGLREAYLKKYMSGVLSTLGLGREDGRTLFVTGDRRDRLYEAMEQVPLEGRALDLEDVDVKDLLETGKVVMERSVLREMIEQHQSDLVSRIFVNGLPKGGPALGEKVL